MGRESGGAEGWGKECWTQCRGGDAVAMGEGENGAKACATASWLCTYPARVGKREATKQSAEDKDGGGDGSKAACGRWSVRVGGVLAV